MNQKQKDVLQAVKEGCKTSAQVAIATDTNPDYCAKILKQLTLTGHIEIYERIKYGARGGGNRYRAVESNYMKKARQEEFRIPPRDPLIAALFGGQRGADDDERVPGQN